MCPFSHREEIECEQLDCDTCKVFGRWLDEDDVIYDFMGSADKYRYNNDSEDKED